MWMRLKKYYLLTITAAYHSTEPRLLFRAPQAFDYAIPQLDSGSKAHV
jgi:hypothetical protein